MDLVVPLLMQYNETPCSTILRELVECEWFLKTNKTGLIHPDGCADLLFDDSGAIYISGISDKSRPLTAHSGPTLRGLRLKPGSIPFFFGVPASALFNQLISVADLSSPVARALSASARQAESQIELAGVAIKLLSQACSTKISNRRLAYALSQIETKSVRVIASSLGITERHLHRLFLREVGLSPSRLKRIRRLQHIIDAMRRMPTHLSMAAFALDQGFFDQAHMNHEVKELTGLTPSDLLHSVAQG